MKDGGNPETLAVRAAVDSEQQYGAVMPPIVLSTNFTFEAVGKPRAYDYTRTANPTRDALAEALIEVWQHLKLPLKQSRAAAE